MGLSKTGSAFTETIIFDSFGVPVREPFSLIIHKSNGKYKINPLYKMLKIMGFLGKFSYSSLQSTIKMLPMVAAKSIS